MPESTNNGRHPRDPLVKKIVALLVPRGDTAVYEHARGLLEKIWGRPERVSERIPFVWTNYYEDIAPELDRIFFSYQGLWPMSALPDWKTASCRIEKETGESRRVNLDPGTIDGARLLLASTKGQAHRVYLRDGIFCEVTLCRRKGRWESFFYTFPDFKSGAYDRWLELVREDWKREVRTVPPHVLDNEHY
ncbi:DUF4416 family protein [Cloacibacillus porcorum]|uniref:DUF4416 family protein n=1 Tax=Cloacibacillus porcorum TaxID=1197717 RepID=UPI0014595626|nr:DUF4416 family protein [Cloacibacillus porcorum]MCC8184521.1 DUF4416 family protein [Cloacibacillus porcorum]MDY5390958.1 DUF4416 family protein [Cloacibacillus porcorum]NMF18085.1 DUF4416 family protein [Cloacibacillus porcorum]